MPEYTLTVENGCKRCGKDAHVVFRKDNHDLPALMRDIKYGTAEHRSRS
jgi:hypothetical protein